MKIGLKCFRLGVLFAFAFVGCNDFMSKDIALGVENESKTSTGTSSSSPGDDDADGISSEVEESFDMDSKKSDSDHDGYADGIEFSVDTGDPLHGSVIPAPLGRVKIVAAEDLRLDSSDSDLDGLGNNFEDDNSLDKNNPDTDGDGYSDGLELVAGADPFRSEIIPIREAPPASDGVTRNGAAPRDGDGDGLSDELELSDGTSATDRDSDNDGFDDGIELLMGSDPNEQSSIPNFSIPSPPEETETIDLL